MRGSRKRRGRAVAVAAALLLALGTLAFRSLPKPVRASDGAYDLSRLADGRYAGSCDNGLVKAEVEVEVRGHAIAEVRIVRHQNGMGSAGEAVAQQVVERQSVEVDAVSGATMSSRTIAKAVEAALASGVEE